MIYCPKCDQLMDMSKPCSSCGWNGRKPNESEERYKKRQEKEQGDSGPPNRSPERPSPPGESGGLDLFLRIDGVNHRCDCGCNVLRQVQSLRYRCNGCGAEYVGEK